MTDKDLKTSGVLAQEEKENEVFSVDDLFNAVRYGTSSHIAYILEKDKNLINRTDLQGYTAIHWAAKRGEVDILALLFSSGANLDTPSTFESKMHPVHWAASDGKINSLKFLLDHRQDINSQDANGCTPVVIATQYNQITAVTYLVKNGADLTLRDNNGDTALHWAAYKGYEELVGLLMHFTPHDLDCEDIFGQTPLHLAALRGNHDVVEYLMVDFGADYSKKDKNGLTALELSVKKSQLKCEWVIRQNSSKNSFDLLRKLGIQRLKDRRVLMYLLLGSNEREFGRWMWRVTFLSNLTATLITCYYALNEVLSDLYMLHLCNTVFQVLWWLCFTCCLYVSPSVVTDANDLRSDKRGKSEVGGKYALHSYDAALEVIGSGISEESPSYPVVCHTCRVQRPLRSKHCRSTRRCVQKFDHFCPFVYNTVGRDNYKWFVGLLTIHPFAYLFFCMTTVYFWRRVSFSWMFILFLLYSLVMCLMVLGLLNYHCKLLASNLTTNEDINMTRYSYMKNEFNVLQNPFDKGDAWTNVLDGLFPSTTSFYSRDQALHASHHQGCSGHSHDHDHQELGEKEGFFEEARVKLLR